MLLGELIDECIYDVVFEAHRNIKQANSVCQICQTKLVYGNDMSLQETDHLFFFYSTRCRSYGMWRMRMGWFGIKVIDFLSHSIKARM